MPRNGPVFQDHHAIEQRTLERSRLLNALSEGGYFNIHAPENRIFLPADPAFAQTLGVSPHSGGPIGDYQIGLQRRLRRLEQTPDGVGAIAGDPESMTRIAGRVESFRDTVRVGLINGDLHTNAPLGLRPDDIRASVDNFFHNEAAYRQAHAAQIQGLKANTPLDNGWAAVTHTEERVISTALHIHDNPNPLTRGGATELQRIGFLQAVGNGYHTGRLSFSEEQKQVYANSMGEEAARTLRVPRGQGGAVSMDLLLGESSARTLTRAGGLLTTGMDAVMTARSASVLMEQGNTTAAQSEVNHAIARNAGGWSGAWVGGQTAAVAMGSSSGFVPAALVVGDAVLMSKAFDKVVDLKENRDIFHQKDRAGVEWQFDGRNWEREASFDRAGDGRPVEQGVVASYAKSQELGAMANAKAVELALGKAPPPQDPFNLPAQASDQRGLDNQNWQRNPESQAWERQVKTSVSGANDRGTYEIQTANPEQTQRLNQEALGRIESNIANGREAIAQAYQESHAAQRGQDYDVGVPAGVEAVKAKQDQVLGSDNHVYQRNLEGQWAGKDGVATGNLAVELELTNQVRQPSLERAQENLTAIQSRPAPTAAQVEQNELLHRYRAAGVDLSVKPGAMEAVERASQQTLQAAGVQGTTLAQLQRNEAGQYGYDSPIVHYQTGADGVAHQVAVTQPGDIREALAEVSQRNAEPSTPTLATVSVTAPKLSKPGREHESTLAQDDQAQRQTASQQASAPVAPDVHHDHALLQEREKEREHTASPNAAQPGAEQPQTSITDPSHAGHTRFKEILSAVHTMEFGKGIAPGPHSEKVAAALLTQGVASGLHINRVEMGADGQVNGIQQSAFDAPRSISIDPKQAQGLSMHEHSEQLAQTLSPHLVSRAPAAERSAEQAQGVAAMSPADQAMFERIRKDVPAHIGDDHVALAVLNTKEAGLHDASKIGMVVMSGDRLWVTGPPLEGLRVATDVSQPAPTLQDTAQQVHAISQQREQQLAQDMQPKPDGPGGRGGPSVG